MLLLRQHLEDPPRLAHREHIIDGPQRIREVFVPLACEIRAACGGVHQGLGRAVPRCGVGIGIGIGRGGGHCGRARLDERVQSGGVEPDGGQHGAVEEDASVEEEALADHPAEGDSGCVY